MNIEHSRFGADILDVNQIFYAEIDTFFSENSLLWKTNTIYRLLGIIHKLNHFSLLKFNIKRYPAFDDFSFTLT